MRSNKQAHQGTPRTPSRWVFGGLLAAGAIIAAALLAQTLVNYRDVSENLVRQEARRTAGERVRGVERVVRVARVETAAAYQGLLDDYRADFVDQIASMALVQGDDAVLAASGAAMPVLTPEARQQFVNNRAPLKDDAIDGRPVLVGIFACRCGLARSPSTERPSPPERLVLQIAIYRGSVSAPFARLRRNAIIGVSAALTLLVALALIAVRFGPYVRGKQLEGQMLIARQVQRALLPPAAAWPVGVDGAAVCVPASQVGGDFYEMQELPDRSLAFSLGDVSGHGIPAALLMGMMHGAMSGIANGTEDAPDRTAARLNRLLLKKSSGERFASMIACVYDPQAGVLRYVNAGHPAGLLIQQPCDGAERVVRLGDGGPVLGVLPDAAYRTALLEVQDGDLLVLFSDGILEATNESDADYGEGRLLAVVERHRHLAAEAICAAVLSSVEAFSARPAIDDRTILIIRLWRAAGRHRPGE